MNNKSMIALTIGIIVLTIGILILVILKGNDMWKWILENVCCCVGKKNVKEVNNGNNYGSINNDPYANQPALKALINSPFEENIRKIDEQYKKEKEERERISNEKDMQDKLDFVTRYPNQATINSNGRLVYIGSENNSRRGSDSGNNSDIDL